MLERSAVGIVFALTTAAASQAEQAQKAASCSLASDVTGVVTSVTEHRTLKLADGREVRLAGIDIPPRPDAAAAMTKMVSGREATLQQRSTAPDRYGRLVAYVSVMENGVVMSVQQALLAAGHARLAGHAGDSSCVTDLIAAERRARASKLGLWGDPYYEIRKAEDPAGVLGNRGRFTLVEGKVVSVRESGATIYVNFGRRWSEDFTVTILKRNERAFAAAGLEPKALAGRRIRVRGYIEERGGPWIEAVAPDQIEIAESQ